MIIQHQKPDMIYRINHTPSDNFVQYLDRIMSDYFFVYFVMTIRDMGFLGQNPSRHGNPGTDIHDRMIVNLLGDN
jgi:hypothetical protein